jgi:integrase
MTLTVKKVAKLKEPGRYLDSHGLYLQVMSANNRSWLLRFELTGRKRWMGLGSVADFTLDEARERARKARQLLADGIDPIAQRKAARATQALAEAKLVTFEEAVLQYYDQHASKWRNRKHRAQFLSTLKTYAFPKIGKLSVAAVDTGLVLKCIEPIWQDKTETANRVRGRIESVLDWATVRGYRTGDNPARWKGHLGEVLPAREKIQRTRHFPALPFSELPAFLRALDGREGLAAQALEFTILTVARTSETIGAQWPEINAREKLWTIPAKRMKAERDHRVPLSNRALEILQASPRERGNPFVFIGDSRGGLSNAAMAAVIDRMNAANEAASVPRWIDPTDGRDIVPHGFRSTFRDWAAERTNYPNHVVEMALAHTIDDKVERAYRRGDLFAKRIRLMAEWARYCGTRPAQAAMGGTVVAMRG